MTKSWLFAQPSGRLGMYASLTGFNLCRLKSASKGMSSRSTDVCLQPSRVTFNYSYFYFNIYFPHFVRFDTPGQAGHWIYHHHQLYFRFYGVYVRNLLKFTKIGTANFHTATLCIAVMLYHAQKCRQHPLIGLFSERNKNKETSAERNMTHDSQGW